MSKKTLFITGTLLSLAIAGSAFAQTGTTTTTTTTTPPTTTNRPDKAAKEAERAANVTARIACVGAAIATRETAIDSAMNTFTQATNASYTARATALAQAYTKTTLKEVGIAVKAAWSTFNTSIKTARKAWQKSRDTAWKEYRTAAAACKAPAGTGDGVNSSLETAGN